MCTIKAVAMRVIWRRVEGVFIGFSCEQHRLARMLDRMAGAEDGVRDALTRYTTVVSGAYYVVPSVEALRKFAAPTE